jgi:putative ABC transport system permease protein
MSIVYRKVWRDLMRNKGRTILVVVSIAVGVIAVGMIFSINNLLTQQMTKAQIASHSSHAKLYLDGNIDDLTVRSLSNLPEVDTMEGAIETSIRWKRSLDDDWEQRPAILIARNDYRNMPYDLYNLRTGDWPDLASADVEFNHAEPFNIPGIGGTIYFDVNERAEPYTINGTLRDPSQFPPPNAQSPTFYVTREVMAELTNMRDFNVLRLTIPEFSQEQAEIAVDAVKERLRRLNVAITYYEITDPQRHPMQDIVNGIGAVLGLMAVMSLFLSVLLVINTINAIIAQQIPQIGVMKTYGGMRKDVAKIYLAGVAIYGLLSLLFAIPLAAVLGFVVANMMLRLFNVPQASFSFPFGAILAMALAGLLAPLLAGLYPVMRGASITVKDAISLFGGATFGTGLVARILGKIRGLPRLVAMPLRNTFRRMGRLFLTELTLVVAGALFLTVMTTGSSVSNTIAQAFESFGYDILLIFKGPQRIGEITDLLASRPEVGRVEMWVWQDAKARLPGATGPGSEKDVALRGYPQDTQFYTPVVNVGQDLASAGATSTDRMLLLNQNMAEEMGVGPGDEIELDLGGDRVAIWAIAGLIQDLTPSGNTIYMYRDVLNQELNQVDRATVAEVKLNLPEQTLENHLKAIEALESYLNAEGIELASTTSSIQDQEQFASQLNILITLLLIMTVLVAAVGGVGLSGTLSINVIERIREIGVMRAVGASSRDLALIFITEGMIIGLISWAFAIPLSVFAGGLFVNMLGGVIGVSVGYFYSVSGIFIWLIIVIILSLFASWLPALHAARISVARSLAYE